MKVKKKKKQYFTKTVKEFVQYISKFKENIFAITTKKEVKKRGPKRVNTYADKMI